MDRLQPFFTPEAIEAESFALIDREAGPERPFSGRAWEIARRIIHTTADFDIMSGLSISDNAIDAGIEALLRGAPVFTDTTMACCGMPRRRFEPLGIEPFCLLNLPGVAEKARELGITRSRAAMEIVGDTLGGAIVAIGNAPTALISLTEHLEAGGTPPAFVVAMPVGFVNAAESKQMFKEYCERKPENAPASIAIMGRKGGSPLAAATLNALAELALRGQSA